jgi:DNA repair protein RadC
MRHLQKQEFKSENFRKYFTRDLAPLAHEVTGMIWLNAKHEVICDEILFHGSSFSCDIDLGKIVRTAQFHKATVCITYHNHPSFIDCEPSSADLETSYHLLRELANANILLLDDLIISNKLVFSFAEHGLLPSIGEKP